MIKGFIDEYGHPLVEIEMSGRKDKLKMLALVDSGFDGELCLPIEIAVPLGLELSGIETIELADGSMKEELVFNGIIKWEGRHTLNSLLADYMDMSKSVWILFESSISETTSLTKKDKVITLAISDEVADILINNIDFDIIEKIQQLNGDDKLAINEMKEFLRNRRQHIVHGTKSGSKNCKDISSLLQNFALTFYDINNNDFKNNDIYLEILQVLQGVCVFLKYFNESLICLLSREQDNKSGYSCIGEFFILGVNLTDNKVQRFCQDTFPIIDVTQRYYFQKVLYRLKSAPNEFPSLGCSLQNPDEATEIITRLSNKIYNFNSLAGVIHLASKIRPFAIHEGKPQNFTFIIGYPYLHKDRLEPISKFSTESIKWHIPGKEGLTITKENEAIYEARARIIGNSLILQEKGVALFVDCNEVEPTCNYLVKPAPHSLSLYKTDIVDIIADVDDAFVLKIFGQNRIEIFHKGKKILVWSHISATWEKESSWDQNSLIKFISKYLSVKKTNNALKVVADTIYQISHMPGHGASFVIHVNALDNKDSLYPEMTIPFPGLGEGEITDSKKLQNVAIEDGGTLIDLTSEKFYGRRQWLPYRAGEPPFSYENFTITEEVINSLKGWDSNSVDDTKCFEMNKMNKLYEMCRFEYLKKKTDNFQESLQIAQKLKLFNEKIIIIFGGYHPSTDPENVVKNSTVDFVVVGEGEETIIELFNAIENDRDYELVSGLAFMKNGQYIRTTKRNRIKNLDELSLPLRDENILQHCKIYGLMWPSPSKQVNTATVACSRGCPFNCEFCCSNRLWGKDVIYRSPQNIVQEIIEIQARFNTNAFFFTDLTFNSNRKWVTDFCNEIIKCDLKFNWYCMCTILGLDEGILQLMSKSGCKKIGFGIETLNDELSDEIKSFKRPSIEVMNKIFNSCFDNDIFTKAYLVIGFPNETHNLLLEYSNKINQMIVDEIKISFYTPFPGTRAFEKYKYKLACNDYSYFDTLNHLVIKNDFLTESEYKMIRAEIIQNFYNDELYVTRIKKRLKRNPDLIESYNDFFKFLRLKNEEKGDT